MLLWLLCGSQAVQVLKQCIRCEVTLNANRMMMLELLAFFC
jgi:hypothetical protein